MYSRSACHFSTDSIDISMQSAVSNKICICLLVCFVEQTEAGLEALEAAMSAGFEQYSKIRSDPNLDNLRKSPKFKELIDRYDEPVFNDNAIKCAPR